MNEQDKQTSGPDVLYATVRGDDIDALKLAALDEARALYGESAPLQIERVRDMRTAINPLRGRFIATVTVRCLQLPDGW